MPRLSRTSKFPRIALTLEDARWVAAAASFHDETPKAFIERVLLPIAREIVALERPIAKPFAASPPAVPPRSFSVDSEIYSLLIDAANIEKLNIKAFAEKHLVPVARKEVIKRVRESQQKVA